MEILWSIRLHQLWYQMTFAVFLSGRRFGHRYNDTYTLIIATTQTFYFKCHWEKSPQTIIKLYCAIWVKKVYCNNVKNVYIIVYCLYNFPGFRRKRPILLILNKFISQNTNWCIKISITGAQYLIFLRIIYTVLETICNQKVNSLKLVEGSLNN